VVQSDNATEPYQRLHPQMLRRRRRGRVRPPRLAAALVHIVVPRAQVVALLDPVAVALKGQALDNQRVLHLACRCFLEHTKYLRRSYETLIVEVQQKGANR
jgi:hypothetical protein